jgi:hypothetical protein
MDPIQVVQTQLDAFNARDIERFVTCFNPDVTIYLGDDSVFAQGHDGIRGLYGQLFANSPNLQATISTRIHVGAWVVDEEHITGIQFEGFPPELHGVFVYQVEGDKIVGGRALM